MTTGSLIVLLVTLGLGIPLIVGGILWLVFRAVAQAIADQRARLEAEGVELDSGLVWITTRYANYRAPGFYAGRAIGKARSHLVLTRERLVVLGPSGHRGRGAFSRADLGQFVVYAGEDGALHLHTDSPPGATGSVDFRVPMADPATWVTALTAAGAKTR